MQIANCPTVSLRIKPHFDSSNDASRLSVTYTLPQIAVQGTHPILYYKTRASNIPCYAYDETNLHASDDEGSLSISMVSLGNNEQEWKPSRAIKGDLTLQMEVYPRKVDITTPMGRRMDLRKDQGGLQGAGQYFLPCLAYEASYSNEVTWDLSLAPAGTRAVWSYGEGPERVTKIGPSTTLLNTVYMVGPVQSHPPHPQSGTQPGFCGSYWFGSLPQNLGRYKNFNSELFSLMSKLFGHEEGTYRVFIRFAIRGWGGGGFDDSYVLEYCPESTTETDNEIIGLFSHEMVHSFMRMNTPEGVEEEWYTEGAAEFYSIFLPYRFNLAPASYLLGMLNGKLSGYFTSPLIQIPMEEAEMIFFDNWYAEMISYNRGFVYLLLMDSRLRKLSGVNDIKAPSPLDEIFVDLAKRSRDGEAVTRASWVDSVTKRLDGPIDYAAELDSMLGGAIVDLSGVFIGSPSNMLVEVKQRVLQYGFDKLSTNTRVVRGVVEGSEAQRAGVRNGDKIVKNTRAGLVQEFPEAKYSLDISRQEGNVTVEWLPREHRQVSCWQLELLNDN